MFKNLDSVPWRDLTHAYGSAKDVPDYIRALTSPDEKAASEALFELNGNIWHQGSVYDASLHAVPFLIEAVRHARPKTQAEILDLLGRLAHGHGFYDVHLHMEHVGDAIAKSIDGDPDETRNAERNLVRDITLAVFDGQELYFDSLKSEVLAVRVAAIELLTKLAQCDRNDPAPADVPEAYLGVRPDGVQQGDFARRLEDIITQDLDAGPNLAARSVLLNVLTILGLYEHKLLSLDRAKSVLPDERYVIVVSQAIRVLKTADELPTEFAALLGEMAKQSGEISTALNDACWPWPRNVAGSILALFGRMAIKDLDEQAKYCVPLLKGGMLMFDYELVLSLILKDQRPQIPDDPCGLSYGQREIALAFLDKPSVSDSFWFWEKGNGNASLACKRFGVPHDRHLWLRWLGCQSWWQKLLPS